MQLWKQQNRINVPQTFAVKSGLFQMDDLLNSRVENFGEKTQVDVVFLKSIPDLNAAC